VVRLSSNINYVDRAHIVRLCREECVERGYSGKAFNECVEECVKKLSN